MLVENDVEVTLLSENSSLLKYTSSMFPLVYRRVYVFVSLCVHMYVYTPIFVRKQTWFEK